MQQQEPTRQRCLYCAEEQDAGHRFCHRCGVRLPEQRSAKPGLFERATPLVPMALVGLALVFALLSLNGSNLPDAGSARAVDVVRIGVDVGYEHFQSGDAVFVDVRDTEAYQAGAIPKAISMPLHKLAVQHQALRRETQVIIYDEGVDRDVAERAAHLLLDLDYEDVVVLEGGFAAWQRAGYQVADPVAE